MGNMYEGKRQFTELLNMVTAKVLNWPALRVKGNIQNHALTFKYERRMFNIQNIIDPLMQECLYIIELIKTKIAEEF